MAKDAQPVVIDTDMAADDWLAILYLLGRPDVDVMAITVTGTGVAHCSAGIQNALGLVALAGRPPMPIACGRAVPLKGDHAFPAEWRESVDDLLGLTLPENNREASDASAVQLLARIIRGSQQKVHLIVLGPLTNVGEALQSEPALAGRYYFWDPLAAAIATEERLSTFVELPLVVVEEEGVESGRTLESEDGFILRVAMTADRGRFEAMFLAFGWPGSSVRSR